MSEEKQTTRVKIPTPFGPIEMDGKKTAEMISILSLCGLLVSGYAIWVHSAEASEGTKATQEILRDMQKTQREDNRELVKAINGQTKAQIYQTCVQTLLIEDRRAEFSAGASGKCFYLKP